MVQPAVEIRGLSKSYGSQLALDGVDLAVRPGECLGLIGPNGAGKTSLLKCLLALRRADAGELALFGEPATRPAARRHLVYLPERFTPPDYMSGRDYLRFVLEAHERGLSTAALTSACRRLALEPEVLARSVSSYSKGMLQKLGILGFLLAERPLLVLDEPMGGLDPMSRRELRRRLAELREQGRTVFLSSHILNDMEALCDRVALLDRGTCRFVGTPADCRAHYRATNLEDALLAAVGAEAA